jgi:hypothetical protein
MTSQWIYHGTLMDAPAWAMYLIDDIHHRIIRAGNHSTRNMLCYTVARARILLMIML